jgi:hypothetical protein
MKHYVLTTYGLKPKTVDGLLVQPYRKFEVPGLDFEVFKAIKTFCWRNPINNTWAIHEVLSGTFIAADHALDFARSRARDAMLRTGEDEFFRRLVEFGPVFRHPEIPYQDALEFMKHALHTALVSKIKT